MVAMTVAKLDLTKELMMVVLMVDLLEFHLVDEKVAYLVVY